VEYLAVIFLAIIIIGLLANRELARDKKRIRQMMREYSFKTYSPEDAEGKEPDEGSKGKKK
jgi:septin family protein